MKKKIENKRKISKINVQTWLKVKLKSNVDQKK